MRSGAVSEAKGPTVLTHPIGAVTCRTMTVQFGSGFRAIGTTDLTARPNSRLHRSLRLVARDTQRLEVGFIVSAALGNVDDVVNL